MKKFVLCLAAFLLTTGTAQAEYIRKKVRPTFFIPAQELDRTEKLPPFPEPLEDADNGETIHYVIPAQTPPTPKANNPHVVVDNHTPPEKVHINFLKTKLMDEQQPTPAPIDDKKILPDENIGQIDTSLEKTPHYQLIRKAYAQDLKTIAETGKAPTNPDVDAALRKMDSNAHIWVDDNFGITDKTDDKVGE